MSAMGATLGMLHMATFIPTACILLWHAQSTSACAAAQWRAQSQYSLPVEAEASDGNVAYGFGSLDLMTSASACWIRPRLSSSCTLEMVCAMRWDARVWPACWLMVNREVLTCAPVFTRNCGDSTVLLTDFYLALSDILQSLRRGRLPNCSWKVLSS